MPKKTDFRCLSNLARTYYSDTLPYHNFKHARRVAGRALTLANQCVTEGLEVDELAVFIAALFHDAGYHEDYAASGCNNREEYATILANEALGTFGYSDIFIEKVNRIILATESRAAFENNLEAKILRAADLADLAGEYRVFLINNKRLKEEEELLSGRKFSWKEWQRLITARVNFYLLQDIKLTSYYHNKKGQSVFHVRARKNLLHFLKEIEEV